MKLDYHAKLLVHSFEDLDKKTRKLLVRWLRARADEFEKPPKEGYSKLFTARLMK